LSKNVQNRTFRRLLGYALAYKWLYAGMLCILLLGIVLDLTIAWFMMQIADTAVLQNRDRFVYLLVAGLVILLTAWVVNFFDTYLKTITSSKIRNQLRQDLFSHILRLPAAYLFETTRRALVKVEQ
jgi:ABC-type multidrug transport system fused ATPase/permease subunit